MRGIDWDTAIAAREHWAGRSIAGFRLCPLLGDLDRLLACLDAIAIRSGLPSRLMRTVDAGLEPVRESYGGREKFETMQREAEAFFARVQISNLNIIR